jgi:hypothetical protein
LTFVLDVGRSSNIRTAFQTEFTTLWMGLSGILLMMGSPSLKGRPLAGEIPNRSSDHDGQQ